MLDRDTRQAILRLRSEGHGTRRIARAVGVSRNAVRRVLASGTVEVPRVERAERLVSHTDAIRELYAECKGNTVRVGEELEARHGVSVAYSTLTGFCRRYGIGVKPKERAGRYYFGPGEEMQHDTSPHDVKVGAKIRRVQCASLVLCYSRMIYAQAYPRFNRFWCKVFLSEALEYFGGAAGRCMIDNSSVVISHGTGKSAVPAPEMEAFSERFGFDFAAHEVGDANRSARVERPFDYVENNFYPGRSFQDLPDLNTQMIGWCDKANCKFKRTIRARPIEFFGVEKPSLKPLPIYIPEVYEVHFRTVDVEGYVSLHTNRYSAGEDLIGREVQVRETKNRVRIYHGHALDSEHERHEDGGHKRCTLPGHEKRWAKVRKKQRRIREETVLREAGPELASLVGLLRRKHGGRAVRPVRRLHRMYLDYPLEPLRKAASEAVRYGLTDLERVERMVLRNVSGDYFQLTLGVDDEKET